MVKRWPCFRPDDAVEAMARRIAVMMLLITRRAVLLLGFRHYGSGHALATPMHDE